MTKGITTTEPNPRVVYADIIDLPHHQSETHAHMSLYNRAAQFSPFAALTGYDDMVTEEARQTDEMIELSQDEMDRIAEQLNLINEQLSDGDITATITYFIPDVLKAGGQYQTITSAITRIDTFERMVVLSDGHKISIDMILDISLCNPKS